MVPGGAPGGGSTCLGGGGGGGYAGGGGLQAGGRGAGGGGGSSYFPAGITAVTTFTDNDDKSPRVQLIVAMGIASVSPAEGSANGETKITITGTQFTAEATVKIGGSDCSPVEFISATEIKCTTAPHAAGRVDVEVTVGSEVATKTDAFEYKGSDDPTPDPEAKTCPLTVINPRSPNKRLPVGRAVRLLKGATTVAGCTLDLRAVQTQSTRGDMARAVRIVKNKKTGRVVVKVLQRGAGAKVIVVATPVLPPTTSNPAPSSARGPLSN